MDCSTTTFHGLSLQKDSLKIWFKSGFKILLTDSQSNRRLCWWHKCPSLSRVFTTMPTLNGRSVSNEYQNWPPKEHYCMILNANNRLYSISRLPRELKFMDLWRFCMGRIFTYANWVVLGSFLSTLILVFTHVWMNARKQGHTCVAAFNFRMRWAFFLYFYSIQFL